MIICRVPPGNGGWKTKLMCNLLGEFGDGIFAVGLDDVVCDTVFHHEGAEMLNLMNRWALLGRADRAAQASGSLNHSEDGDVLLFLTQLVS